LSSYAWKRAEISAAGGEASVGLSQREMWRPSLVVQRQRHCLASVYVRLVNNRDYLALTSRGSLARRSEAELAGNTSAFGDLTGQPSVSSQPTSPMTARPTCCSTAPPTATGGWAPPAVGTSHGQLCLTPATLVISPGLRSGFSPARACRGDRRSTWGILKPVPEGLSHRR
jgi:hypothetical protein